jgi:DNA-binding NarL/FixJ family response regulator
MFKTLIIDANVPFRRSLKQILSHQFPFVRLEEASSGSEGLSKIEALRPDLIFVDIHLPGEAGLELVRKIRAEHPDIIILIITSSDLPEYQTAARQHGVRHFISKDSWTGEEILKLFKSVLFDLGIDEHGMTPNSHGRK